MGLAVSAYDCIGKRLTVKTHYGWGWEGPVLAPLEVPNDFTMELANLWKHGDQLRGGIGRVADGGHMASDWWVSFATRHAGEFDITSVEVICNLSLGESRPLFSESGWPLFENRYCSGYGGVRLLQSSAPFGG